MKNKIILFQFCPICYELLHTLCRKDGVVGLLACKNELTA